MNPNLIFFAVAAIAVVIFASQSGIASPVAAGLRAAVSPTVSRALALRIAQIAEAEYKRVGGRKETDPSLHQILIGYWLASGRSSGGAEAAMKAREYWSAAFVSYCVKIAGAGSRFKYSEWHVIYCAQAKRNRIQNITSNPFWLYKPSERVVKIGDFLCNARAGSGVTFENVDDGKLRGSHCDIVVAVNRGSVTVIGGNVDDTVTRRTVPTDATGRVSSVDHYAVLGVNA